MNITTPFDILAETYDADFTTSSIGILQRERVWHYLTMTLNSMGNPLNMLEINCGTGEDAFKLSELGHKVIATDASAAMIKKAKLKLRSNEVEFITCSFDELGTTLNGRQFDFVLSNFGGLNCTDKQALRNLSVTMDSLVKPGGKLFLVVMSDWCAWEIIHYGIRAKFSTAFRRLKEKVIFKKDDNEIYIHYYSPSSLQKIFSGSFVMQNKFPVGLFIPPSYLEQKFSSKKKLLNRLVKLEKKTGNSFLARFADHYCGIFTKPA
ncbi:MAG: class I SAM-dependent methyltransferase [Bacteroidota bacterium]